MNIGESTVLEKVQLPTSGARHITLIDPAKQSADVAAQRAMLAVECGSAMIFIGGSTDTPDDVVHATCTAIQEAFELRMFAASQDPTGDERQWDIPVVLFPGGAHALSPAADAITFMMLMNSTKREFWWESRFEEPPTSTILVLRPCPQAMLCVHRADALGRLAALI